MAKALGESALGDVRQRGWAVIKEARKQRTSIEELQTKLITCIIRFEKDLGSEWLVIDEGRLVLADRAEMQLVPIGWKDTGFKTWLGNRYGLFSTDPVAKTVVAALEVFVATRGRHVTSRRFAHWDGDALHVSQGNGNIWSLNGKEIKTIANGDGIAVFEDKELDPCEADIGPHGILAPRLVNDLQYATDCGLSAADQRLLFLSWILACGMANRFPSKPILLLDGDAGSGKTLSVQRVMATLTGYDRPMVIGNRDEEDFPVKIYDKAPIACLDNQDTEIAWLRDAIASYATSGGWPRRVLYTTATSQWLNPQCFIAVTSRNPTTYRRPDIADRCLILRLEHRPQKTSPMKILDSIRADRPRLLGEWLWLANRCVAAFKTLQLSEEVPYRMVDFAHMVQIVAHVTGLGGGASATLLAAAQSERDSLVLEDEPIVELIDRWLNLPNKEHVSWSSVQLCDSFQSLAEGLPGRKFNYTPWSLVRRLRTLAPSLRGHGIVLQHKQDGTKSMWTINRATNGHRKEMTSEITHPETTGPISVESA